MILNIVVIDDQPAYRTLVREVLGPRFHVVSEADSYETALREVAKHRPAGVIVDVNIGARNGFHLAADLIKHDPALKILLTSAYAEPVYTDLAERIPGAAFLEKARLTTDALIALWLGPELGHSG